MRENEYSRPRVYLAARYSRREELRGYATELEALGFEVTSRWLTTEHLITDEGLSAQLDEEKRTRFALEDWEDVKSADIVVSLTEEPRKHASRGGRHVEFGAGLAWGAYAIICGPRENVFHCLPWVHQVESWAEAVTLLARQFGVGVEEAAS